MKVSIQRVEHRNSVLPKQCGKMSVGDQVPSDRDFLHDTTIGLPEAFSGSGSGLVHRLDDGVTIGQIDSGLHGPGHPSERPGPRFLGPHLAKRRRQKIGYEPPHGFPLALLQLLQVSEHGIVDIERRSHDELTLFFIASDVKNRDFSSVQRGRGGLRLGEELEQSG